MATQYIKFKRSSIPGKRPSNSQMELGELALNTNDGRLFTKKENVGIGTTVTLLNVWTENVGGGAYYTDGNIGIGITNPTAKLQVFGAISAGNATSGTFESGYFLLRPNDSQYRSFAVVEDDTILRIGGGAWNAVNIRTAPNNEVRVAITSSGNVGIGTTNPTSRLHIIGDSLVTGVVTATAFNGNINAGIGTITNLSGTNVSYSGIGTIGTLDVNSADIDNLNTINISNSGIITTSNLVVNDEFDVYAPDSTFHDNVVIQGNLTVNGTQVILNVDDKFIKDKQIVLGFSTTNDVDDTTANGGGFGIASTEGSPLVCLQCTGINTLPSTYKQLIWTKANTFGAGTTDAFLFNYAVGIGSTLVPNGVRLSVGGVKITDSDVNATTFTGSGANLTSLNASNISSGTLDNARLPQNISVSGVITATTFSGNLQNTLTLNTSGTGLSGSATFNNSSSSTFTVTSNATSNNTGGTIVARNANGGFSAGIVTATFVGNVTGNLNSSGVNTAATLSGTTLTYTTGTFDNINVSGITTTALLNVGVGGTIITTTSNGSVGIGTTNPITQLHLSGFSTTNSNLKIGSLEFQNYSLNNSFFGDNVYWNGSAMVRRSTGAAGLFYFFNDEGQFRLSPVGLANSETVNSPQLKINSNGSFGVGVSISQNPNNFTGSNFYVSPQGNTLIGSISSTGTASQRLQVTGGAYVSGSVGIGTTNPIEKLDINGNIRVSSGSTFVFGTGPGLGATSSGYTYALSNPFTSVQIGGIAGRTGNALVDIRASNYPDATNVINIQTTSETYTGTIGTYKPFTPAGTVIELGNTRSNDRIGLGNTQFGASGALVSIYAYNNNSVTNAFFGAVAGNVSNGPANFVFGRRTGAFSWEETVRIDTSGNLGIGTTNPTSRLHIIGDALVTGVVTATAFNGNINAGVGTITNLSGTNVSYSGIGTVGSLNIGSTQVISSARELQNIASLDATTTATIETAIANAPNTFTDLQVTGVSTFTNGPVLIGSGTSTGVSEQRLQVTGGAYISDNTGIGTTNPTSKLTVQGDVLVSGVITSTDYNSASDINLKENIQPIENPIDKVLNITGVSFDWKEDGRSSMGVIAQEVERVLPELVSGSDTKTVNYNGLIGLLIEVVKEQQQRINSLEERFK